MFTLSGFSVAQIKVTDSPALIVSGTILNSKIRAGGAARR
jgi:hypothetical protein